MDERDAVNMERARIAAPIHEPMPHSLDAAKRIREAFCQGRPLRGNTNASQQNKDKSQNARFIPRGSATPVDD
jgi:hypothetical protein